MVCKWCDGWEEIRMVLCGLQVAVLLKSFRAGCEGSMGTGLGGMR